MNVKMLSYKVNDIGGVEEGHYVLDFTRRESRIWSGKYTSYAMTNGIAIIIMPTDDPVTYTPNDEKVLDVNKLRNNSNFRFKDSVAGTEVKAIEEPATQKDTEDQPVVEATEAQPFTETAQV